MSVRSKRADKMNNPSPPDDTAAPPSSAIVEFFDGMAVDRNAIFRSHPILDYEQRVRSRAVLRALDANPGETVLDIGCGNARDIPPIIDRGAHIVGVDVSPGMIEQATTDLAMAGHRGVDLQVGDATGLRFAAGTFDKVLCSEVIEHIPDADEAVREMCRVLKNGGTLVISTPNRTSWYGFDRYVVWQGLLRRKWNHPFDNWREMSGLIALLERHGLQITDRRTVCYTPGFLLTYKLPRTLQAAVSWAVSKIEPLASGLAPGSGYLLVVRAVKSR